MLEHFWVIFNAIMVVFVYMAVGFFCRKGGILGKNSQKDISRLVTDVVFAFVIFDAFNQDMTTEKLRNSLLIFAVSFGVYLLSHIFGILIYGRLEERRRPVYQFSILINNASFIGIPVTQSIYGEEGALYASMFTIVMLIFLWTAGVSYYEPKLSFGKKLLQVASRPVMIALFLALIRLAFQIELPPFLNRGISSIAALIGPLSMIVVGVMAADIPFREIFDLETWKYSFVRLIGVPAVMLLLILLAPLTPVIRSVAALLISMPAGAATVLFAERYDSDVRLGTRLVLSSTILSLITVPLIYLITKALM